MAGPAPLPSGDAADPFWSRDAPALIAELSTAPEGLSSAEAAARLERHGRNALAVSSEAGALRLFLRQFKSPLVLILLVGAGISLIVREWADAWLVLAIVLGSALLGFVQEHRASAAIAELRRGLALTARVRRDGAEATVDAATIVPGDIVVLSAGNLVPADGVVVEARDFLVNEATLTGESLPVEKRPGAVAADVPAAARTNAAFLGTSVRSGAATLLAVRTGARTEYAAIAGSLARREPESDFAHGLRRFGNLLVSVMIVVMLFVLTVNLTLGRPPIESLMFAVALAVGLSPELLPAIVSVTLSAGARAMAARGVIVRRLEAIENLGSMDVLCTDKTGTLTTGAVALARATGPDGSDSAEVRQLAYLNALFETGIDNPLDAAIVADGEAAGLDAGGHAKVDEIPYDFTRKRLTIVVAPGDGRSHRIIAKGAVANILSVCTSLAGGEALDAAATERLDKLFRGWGADGYRVLGLATKEVAPKPRYAPEDEADLAFAGFLIFRDPPRADAERTLADLARLGVTVKVITGDNRHVTAHLAEAIGLDHRAMLTGPEIAALRDESLWHRVERTDLFVEVDPQQKLRIVRALQHRGHSVGYLGDGINDAPALHAADVGISVDGAVDVARESADVILLRPDLGVLRQGVVDGRHTLANTLKYIGITISANFGNMVSMAVVAPLLPFMPLTATQILLNNLLSDLPLMAISTDAVDPERIERAQRWDIAYLRRYMIVFGLISSVFDAITFATLLLIFQAGATEFQTAWFVVSLLTELVVVLVLRTRRPAWKSRPGPLVLWTTVAVAVLAVVLPYLPAVAALFRFVPLPPTLLAISLAIVGAYAAATEFAKHRFFGRVALRPRRGPVRDGALR